MDKGSVDLTPFFAGRGIQVRENFSDEPREERFGALPPGYDKRRIRDALNALGIRKNRLWHHQAEALEWTENGYNVSLTTQTASGKSIPLMLPVLKRLIETPNDTALIFYPVKALSADQKRKWDTMIEAAGIDPATIAKIDGSDPVATRDDLFSDKTRVLIITPDCFHAWFMANLNNPKYQKFIANLMQCNLDEMHLYDGYFGTAFSMMARRIKVLRAALRIKFGIDSKIVKEQAPMQFVATSATMEDPQKFLHELVATRPHEDLNDIGPDECGSSTQPRQMIRIEPKSRKNFVTSVDTAIEILRQNPKAKIMLFIDSRKKVEQEARKINTMLKHQLAGVKGIKLDGDLCRPYRSGFSNRERTENEEAFMDPDSGCQILVTTSATEVGVDISAVDYVVSAGIPVSQKSIIQRAGRLRGGGMAIFVGRGTKDDVFKEAMTTTPRNPVLHRGDESAQFQAALCLTKELSDCGIDPAKIKPGGACTWPPGFVEHYRTIASGEPLRDHLSAMKAKAGKNPHLTFTLRTSEGKSVSVFAYSKSLGKNIVLENLSGAQYVREAYPGAIFLHNQRAYRVGGLSENNNVTGRLVKEDIQTQPKMKSETVTYLNAESCSRLKVNKEQGGFVAAAKIKVREEVFGFVEKRKGSSDVLDHNYDDNSPFSSEPVKYERRVEGITISFNDLAGKENADLRRKLAAEFRRVAVERYEVSNADITATSNNNRVAVNGFTRIDHDGQITLFDRNANYRGKTGLLYRNFEVALRHIIRTTDHEDVKDIATRMHQWSKGLTEVTIPTMDQAADSHLPNKIPAGHRKALFKGSIVQVTEKGSSQFAKILGATSHDGEVLYQVEEIPAGKSWSNAAKQNGVVKRFVPAKRVKPIDGKFKMWSLVDTRRADYVDADYFQAPARPEAFPALQHVA